MRRGAELYSTSKDSLLTVPLGRGCIALVPVNVGACGLVLVVAQPSQRLPLKPSKMEAGVKAVEYFFHQAVISAPLLPNLISCPIFKVAKKKKKNEKRKERNVAGSLGVCQLRARVIIPSSTLGGRFQEGD